MMVSPTTLFLVLLVGLASPLGTLAACSPKDATDALKKAQSEASFKGVLDGIWKVPTQLEGCGKSIVADKALTADGKALLAELANLEAAVTKKFPKELAEDWQTFRSDEKTRKTPAAAKKFMLLEVNRRLMTSKSSHAARDRARTTIIRRLLRNAINAIRAFFAPAPAVIPAAPAPVFFNAGMCPADAAIFSTCVGPHRAWAQNVGNCHHPMSNNIGLAGAAPVAAAYDWNNNAGAAVARAANAFAVIGFHGDINVVCPAGNNFGAAENLNRLNLYNNGWDECVNLQWVFCAAHGQLPNQGTADFVVATSPSGMDTNPATNGGHGWGITNDEYCALNRYCNNAVAMWAHPARLAPWVAGTAAGLPNTWTCAHNLVVI